MKSPFRVLMPVHAILTALFRGVLAIPTTSSHVPTIANHEESGEPVTSSVYWWKLGFSAILVLLGGAFAG